MSESNKLIFAETDKEKVDAVLYQAMFDETIRLRTCISRRERQQIREFIKETYELYVGLSLQNEKQYIH